MKPLISLLMPLVSFGMVLPALAGNQNDIPSCYAANYEKLQRAAPIPNTEVFVLIDETTLLSDRLKSSVQENVSGLLKAGTAVVVATFSAFSQGKFMDIAMAGTLETTIPEKERGSISVKVLQRFDECMKGQFNYGQQMVRTAIGKAMDDATSERAKSDIVSSIKELSSRAKQSPAKNKIIFIVSDMLENSSISTFYAAKNVRFIDVNKELGLVEKANMYGDFAGANVYILGAGIVPEDIKSPKGIYRDPKTMAQLKNFWKEYLARSNATLVEFGAPALMNPVR